MKIVREMLGIILLWHKGNASAYLVLLVIHLQYVVQEENKGKNVEERTGEYPFFFKHETVSKLFRRKGIFSYFG